MRNFTDTEIATWHAMIGKRVWKNPKTTSTTQPKPFKSGLKVNTVTGIVTHEQTGRLGFTFLEDATVVECWRCSLAPEEFKLDDIGARGVWNRIDNEMKEIREMLRLKAATHDGHGQPKLLEGVILKGFK